MKPKKLTADKLAGIITASVLAVGVTLSASAVFTSGLYNKVNSDPGINDTVGASTDPAPGESTDPTPGQSAIPTPGETDFDPEDVVPGDADGNGETDLLDSIALSRWLAGWDVEIIPEAADMDHSGEVDLVDSILLVRRLAGWNV